MNAQPRRRAVFLDRDGTLTVEVDWVRSARDLVLLPGAARATAALNAAGYPTVLVTNQSAIARGMLSEDELRTVHAHLAAELACAGARLDAIYYCPHHPTEGSAAYRKECACRKPRPGLLQRAALELELDLASSWIVGDAERDLAAGRALGVRGILVSTGKGRAEAARMRAAGGFAEPCVADLAAAVEWILAADRAAVVRDARDQGR